MAMITTNSIGLSPFSSKADLSIKSLNDTYRQLSGGLKAGQGFESAALIAIANRFSSQVKGTNQALLQVNDGISLAQVGSASLEDVNAGFQRLQELAVQGADSTLNDEDRQALQEEATAVQEQIRSILANTRFNDISVLGSDQTLSFKAGEGDASEIQVRLRDLRSLFQPVDLSTQSSAQGALQAVQDVLEMFTKQSADFQTAEGQLTNVATALSRISDTLGSAEGGIFNADMADKISNSIAMSIRAQAGIALQTQADRLSGSRVQQLLQ